MMTHAVTSLKKHIIYNCLFFLLLIVLFTTLYLNNTLILSLATLETQPLISDSFLAFLTKLNQRYLAFYQVMIFVIVVLVSLFCFGKIAYRKQEIQQTIKSGISPFALIWSHLIESFLIFSSLLVLFFIFILLFQVFLEKIVIHFHVVMTESIQGFPYELEKIMKTDSTDPFVIRITNTKQVFEYLLYLSEEGWSRLFLIAYVQTTTVISACLISSHVCFSWFYIYWQRKKS